MSRAREADDRMLDMRPPMDAWAPPSILETPPNVGGFRFRWIREYVNGHHDPSNVQTAIREGYQRVRIQDLPEGFVVDEDLRGDGYARSGGLLLMKLPDEIAVQRQRYYEKRSRSALEAANELQGVAGRHAVTEDRSRVLTGREFGELFQGKG